MPKNFVYINSVEKHINPIAIGYMDNPTINDDKVLREIFDKCPKEKFHPSTISGIRNVIKNNNTCVIAIVMFYESRGTNIEKVFMVLRCVLYSVI